MSSTQFSDAETAKTALSTLESDKMLLAAVKKATSPKATQLVSEAEKNLAAFETSLSAQQNKLEQSIRNELRSKNMIAKRYEMVTNQALASGSNVPQGMVMMYKKTVNLEPFKRTVGLYTALANTPSTKKNAKDFGQQIKKIESIGVKMGAVDSAVTPRDSYTGQDKGDLTAQIEKQWKATYATDTILGIHFIDEKWSRKAERRYNNVTGFYDIDFSSLEVKVVVKQDEQTALIYPVFLTKDHMQNNQLQIDVETAKSNAFFKSEMLLKNYK